MLSSLKKNLLKKSNQWKIPDEDYNVIILIEFHRVILLGNVVGSLHSVSVK